MPAERSGARRPFAGRTIVLGVTGGIAAYKAIQVARDLAGMQASVEVVLTHAALEFVRPLSFEALTGRLARSELYTSGDPLVHIRLARAADLVVIAPATANFIARASAGLGDDLLTAILLATRAPVLLCPAMNDAMFAHPLTVANLSRLGDIGYHAAGPAVGPLAWGEGEGPGRLLEPDEIIAHCGRLLEPRSAFTGQHVVVTAGPTREPVDPVRFLGNRSSGKMGYAIASAAWRRGAAVTLISGPSALQPPVGVDLVRVETSQEMHAAVREALPSAVALVMAAAVADYRPTAHAPQKLKKEGGVPDLHLESTPDILSSTRDQRPAGCVVVGFALETENSLEHGRKKLEKKDLDLVVVNDAREPGAGFEVETNRVTILDRAGSRIDLPLLAKHEVAERILDLIEPRLPSRDDV